MNNKATINISNVNNYHDVINPFIYGNFMEFLDDHISGMWSEKLQNRKFEDYLPGKSFANYWYGSGFNNIAEYGVDKEAYNGEVCQFVNVIEDKGGEKGISQDGISVEKGKKYSCTVHLRQQDIRMPVRIMLGRDYGVYFRPYASAIITCVTGEWSKYSFTLSPDVTDENATFSIQFSGKGKLWADEVSLMPEDSAYGWRTDVLNLLRELKPNILRFPGGCYADIYHWYKSVGDPFKRPAADNFFWSGLPHDYRLTDKQGERHYRLTEPNDVGTDEFMKLCELTGSEALICVNLGTGTPEEAADWVEYCNGDTNTKNGRMRALNGHPEPYNIKYWQIGNEMNGSHEIGYSGLEGYVKGYINFYKAMKKVDPSIKFLADGADSEWNRGVLKSAGEFVDYLDIHLYPGIGIDICCNTSENIFRAIMSRSFEHERYLCSAINDIKDCGYEGRIKLAICEWNFSGGGWGAARARFAMLGNAILSAATLNMFQRHSDIVEIANFSNLTNAWWASCIITNSTNSFSTPEYHTLSLYSHNCGEKPLSVSVECDNYEVNREKIPFLDCMATLDTEGKTAILTVVNRNTREEIHTKVGLGDLTVSSAEAFVITLTGESPESLNDFPFPDAVRPAESKVYVSNEFEYDFPPCSLTLIRVVL